MATTPAIAQAAARLRQEYPDLAAVTDDDYVVSEGYRRTQQRVSQTPLDDPSRTTLEAGRERLKASGWVPPGEESVWASLGVFGEEAANTALGGIPRATGLFAPPSLDEQARHPWASGLGTLAGFFAPTPGKLRTVAAALPKVGSYTATHLPSLINAVRGAGTGASFEQTRRHQLAQQGTPATESSAWPSYLAQAGAGAALGGLDTLAAAGGLRPTASRVVSGPLVPWKRLPILGRPGSRGAALAGFGTAGTQEAVEQLAPGRTPEGASTAPPPDLASFGMTGAFLTGLPMALQALLSRGARAPRLPGRPRPGGPRPDLGGETAPGGGPPPATTPSPAPPQAQGLAQALQRPSAPVATPPAGASWPSVNWEDLQELVNTKRRLDAVSPVPQALQRGTIGDTGTLLRGPQGELVFATRQAGPGATGAYRHAVWLNSPTGKIQLMGDRGWFPPGPGWTDLEIGLRTGGTDAQAQLAAFTKPQGESLTDLRLFQTPLQAKDVADAPVGMAFGYDPQGKILWSPSGSSALEWMTDPSQFPHIQNVVKGILEKKGLHRLEASQRVAPDVRQSQEALSEAFGREGGRAIQAIQSFGGRPKKVKAALKTASPSSTPAVPRSPAPPASSSPPPGPGPSPSASPPSGGTPPPDLGNLTEEQVDLLRIAMGDAAEGLDRQGVLTLFSGMTPDLIQATLSTLGLGKIP